MLLQVNRRSICLAVHCVSDVSSSLPSVVALDSLLLRHGLAAFRPLCDCSVHTMRCRIVCSCSISSTSIHIQGHRGSMFGHFFTAWQYVSFRSLHRSGWWSNPWLSSHGGLGWRVSYRLTAPCSPLTSLRSVHSVVALLTCYGLESIAHLLVFRATHAAVYHLFFFLAGDSLSSLVWSFCHVMAALGWCVSQLCVKSW